jgi:hypothetical protein
MEKDIFLFIKKNIIGTGIGFSLLKFISKNFGVKTKGYNVIKKRMLQNDFLNYFK